MKTKKISNSRTKNISKSRSNITGCNNNNENKGLDNKKE